MSNHSNRRPEGSNGNTVHEQAAALLKEGIRNKIPSSKIAELRKKFSDDELIDKIQEAFYDRLNEINKRAKKFVKFVEKKFGDKGLPLHLVLKESKKYRQKYNLSDLEFAEFKKQYEKMMNARLPNREQQSLMPNTNMAQLFGDVNSLDGIVVRDADFSVVQDIIKMHTMTRGTHNSVILQSMQYSGCDDEVMTAQYDTTRHNVVNAINPLIAAMFAPKVHILESHFLYTNISYIVKCKYNKEPIQNASDINLLHQMIIDSTDIVCSSDTPLKDIRLRCNVQNNLWNSVLSMRAGKFFDPAGNDFFNAIDECKISIHDAPDLVYAGDEGVILKRLLSAMSFNPLLVSTNPVFGVNGTSNPVNFPVIANKVVSRPFLSLRLPPPGSDEVLTLESAATNSQVYIENGMFVPKTQTILHCRGVIIFHVPRRTVAAIDTYQHMISATPQFTQIPSHILVNERINDSEIVCAPVIAISGAQYSFVSGIVLETFNPPASVGTIPTHDNMRTDIVVGTAAIVRNTNNGSVLNYAAPYHIYSPKMITHNADKTQTQLPVWEVLDVAGNNTGEKLLASKGTIFIYRDVNN